MERRQINALASLDLRQYVLAVMPDDEISRSITNDELIISFGNELIDKFRRPHHLIQTLLRRLGRLKLNIKRIDADIHELASIIQPQFCNTVMVAFRELGQYNTATGTFRSLVTATMHVTTLRQCISHYKDNYDLNYEARNAAGVFLEFLEESHALFSEP